jgi:hypothetical protein
MKWLCCQRWLVSTPIQRYTHQANPRLVLLDVETCWTIEHGPGVGVGTCPPPRAKIYKAQQPPLVVGGGLVSV